MIKALRAGGKEVELFRTQFTIYYVRRNFSQICRGDIYFCPLAMPLKTETKRLKFGLSPELRLTNRISPPMILVPYIVSTHVAYQFSLGRKLNVHVLSNQIHFHS